MCIERGYDGLFRKGELVLKDNATALHTVDYTYGAVSRLASVGTGSEVVEYAYLTNSSLAGTLTFKQGSTSVMTTNREYDFVNRLTQTESIAGVTPVSSHEYSHTVLNQRNHHALIASYTYDDQSRRVRKQTTSNAPQGEEDKVYVWDGWLNIAELAHASGTFTPTHYYTWGLDISGSEQGAGGVGGLAMQKDVTNSEVYYTAYDGNGNVSALVKGSDGTIAAQYEYDPFGNVIASSGMYADVNRWRFSTKFADVENGLLYYGFRYYSSELGRWLGRDPAEEDGGLNLYSFVQNDGVNRWDYLGLAVEAVIRQNQEMKIDADGAPNAYGPNNSGLDWTANGGRPGNWWAIVTDKRGNPVIQGKGDPFPGMYVSKTSLIDGTKRETDPARYVDSRFVPYIVYYRSDRSNGARVGDIASVVDTEDGSVRHGIVADYKGAGKGEASMYMATLFGVNSNPRLGGTSDKRFCYIIYKSSSQSPRWPVHNGTILREGDRLHHQWEKENPDHPCACIRKKLSQ